MCMFILFQRGEALGSDFGYRRHFHCNLGLCLCYVWAGSVQGAGILSPLYFLSFAKSYFPPAPYGNRSLR